MIVGGRSKAPKAIDYSVLKGMALTSVILPTTRSPISGLYLSEVEIESIE